MRTRAVYLHSARLHRASLQQLDLLPGESKRIIERQVDAVQEFMQQAQEPLGIERVHLTLHVT